MRVHLAIASVVSLACLVQAPAAFAQGTTFKAVGKKLGKRAPVDEACLEPFVHRAAVYQDYVCVTRETWNTTRDDNQSAALRRNPKGGPYGPDTCLAGFVWRGVVPTDHVCVTPKTRGDIAVDNQANAARKKKPLCEQYTRQAMASVVESARVSCAPASNAPYWSQNQADHYSFCMASPQANATQASQARETGLQACKVAAAEKARQEQEELERQEKQAQIDAEMQKKAKEAALAKKKADEAAAAKAKEVAAAKAKQDAADRAHREKCENGTVFEQLGCKFGGASQPAPAKS